LRLRAKLESGYFNYARSPELVPPELATNCNTLPLANKFSAKDKALDPVKTAVNFLRIAGKAD
jgi:hypothetical protein